MVKIWQKMVNVVFECPQSIMLKRYLLPGYFNNWCQKLSHLLSFSVGHSMAFEESNDNIKSTFKITGIDAKTENSIFLKI